jgi:hypothetical protein
MADAAVKNLDLNVGFAGVPTLEAEGGQRGGRILGGVAKL